MAVLYTAKDGRQLTDADLRDVGGAAAAPWDEAGIPDEAHDHLEKAEELRDAGKLDDALQSLAKAQLAMKQWPEPTYEAAWVLLLKGDIANAEQFYGKVDRLAPRGFLHAMVYGDTLRRERLGEIPVGTLKEYVRIEGIDDGVGRRVDLDMLLAKAPAFPAGWLMLVGTSDSPQERLDTAEKGLAHNPDPETKGLLLVAKANAMGKLGQIQEAVQILGPLALDHTAPHSVEQAAKMSFKNMSTRKADKFTDAEALRVALWKTAARSDRKHLAELCNKNKDAIFKNYVEWLLIPDFIEAVPTKKQEWEGGLKAVAQYFDDFGDASLSAKFKAMTNPEASLNMLWTQARDGGTMLGAYATAFLTTEFVIPVINDNGQPVPYFLENGGVLVLMAFTGARMPANFFDQTDVPPDGHLKIPGAGLVDSLQNEPTLHFSVNPHTSVDQVLPPEFITEMRAFMNSLPRNPQQ